MEVKERMKERKKEEGTTEGRKEKSSRDHKTESIFDIVETRKRNCTTRELCISLVRASGIKAIIVNCRVGKS
jgi:hypothetical protein